MWAEICDPFDNPWPMAAESTLVVMLGAIANWAAAMVLAVAILDFAMLVPAHAAAWTE